MIVHCVRNEHEHEHEREHHVLVMDRLEDSNCLAVADGLTMPNSNDYVLE